MLLSSPPSRRLGLAALLILAATAGAPPRADAAPVRLTSVTAAAPPTWEETLDRAANSVVAIRVSATRSFDTESASTSVATGFVVDAERGILLTNRHVVQPGPVVAEAVFANHEEVALTPIYRDPVHDFGFYQFDPAALRHMDVVALPLHPEEARVGVEIRVVGNDAGEKVSILSGTLARLDREAPSYGRGYNDFNTFYYQAASGTSGGSSGSPVLNRDGHVVALNAGGRRDAASSFYLPLDRVVRALDLVRAGSAVPRGGWQAVLVHQPFGELRRLGLTDATEGEVRAAFPAGTGLLVVDDTLPGSSARALLRPGDVVVKVGGALVDSFLPMEIALDDRVGGSVAVEVERAGVRLALDVPVEDLHALTPAEFVEVGGSVLHPLGLQLARSWAVPIAGLYAPPGGPFLARAGTADAAIVTSLNGVAVPTLDALQGALEALPEGAPVQIGYRRLADPTAARVTSARMSWSWYPVQRCRRDDTLGQWPCTPLTRPAGAYRAPPGTAEPFSARSGPAKALATSLAWVHYEAPIRPEGVYGDSFIGTGVVLDAERGLVLTDRDTVPVAAGEVSLTFGGAVEVPAEVVLVHPFHDLALLRYDPALLGDTPVTAAELRAEPLSVGDSVSVVGLASPGELVSAGTTVRDVSLIATAFPDPPYFRDTNLTVVDLGDAGRSVGGVIADKKGRMVGLYASFVNAASRPWTSLHRGIPTAAIQAALGALPPEPGRTFRSLGVELGQVGLSDARELGLPQDEIDALLAHGGSKRAALAVRRVWTGTPAAAVLRGGDILVRIGGLPVTTAEEVEAAAGAPVVRVSVLREGKLLDLDVPTFAAEGEGTRRMLSWAGALIHTTPLAVAMQRGAPAEGVYVSWIWNGSPAQAWQLWPTRRILSVDDVPTPDLDAFLAAVRGRPDRSSVRLRTAGLDNKESVVTLKLDLAGWPTAEIRWDGAAWARTELR